MLFFLVCYEFTKLWRMNPWQRVRKSSQYRRKTEQQTTPFWRPKPLTSYSRVEISPLLTLYATTRTVHVLKNEGHLAVREWRMLKV
jgi:hypothetical protein